MPKKSLSNELKYTLPAHYLLNIVNLQRKLPIIEIEKEKLAIASFVMLGDTELNYRCAKEFVNIFKNNRFDYVIVPEAKAIPLAQSICQELYEQRKTFLEYIVLRKSVKAYMEKPLIEEVKSITTNERQRLILNKQDAQKIKGIEVCLIDDVISTGNSYRAMVSLIRRAGAKIKFAGAVLREGNFDLRDIEEKIGEPIHFLGKIPIFEK